jgi:serine/threonine-protein kinase
VRGPARSLFSTREAPDVTLDFRVLGGINLHDGEREELDSILARPKRLALFTYLCLEGGDGMVRRDRLLPLFWPDADEAHARAALSQALHVLRRSLGSEVVVTRGRDEVGIDLEAVRCDAVAFRRALASGDREAALVLYGGDLLPGLHVAGSDFERWLEAERGALRTLALEAALALAADADASGDAEAARSAWRRALEIVPESEAAARGLVLSLWRTGRRSAALETYESFAGRLAADFGAEPGAHFVDLVSRIRRGDAAPGAGPAAVIGSGPGASPRFEASRPAEALVSELSTSPEPEYAGAARRPAWRMRIGVPVALAAILFVLLGMWAARGPAPQGTARFDAETEYGRAWAAWLSGEKVDSAVIYATRAIEADSTHARAWALRAYTGLLRATRGTRPAREVIPAAYDDARRAVALDDTLAAAVQALASAQWISKEWEAAEATYRRALSLRTRGMWEALGRIDLSALFMEVGRCDEAWEVIEPYARLEPLERPYGSIFVVRIPYYCRDWPAAIREVDRAVAGGEASFRVLEFRFLARLLAGDLEAAEADLADIEERLGPGPALDRLEALLLVRRGDTARARTIAAELVRAAESGDPFDGTYTSPDEPMIQLLVALGDREAAFARMDSLMAFKGHVRRLASDPLLDPLRDDPRIDGMLAQMNLICRGLGQSRVCQPIE